MTVRQRSKFFSWATAAAFIAPGKSWDGLTPRLEPGAGLASEGVEPGQALGARVFNFLVGLLVDAAMRVRNFDLANWRESGDTSPVVGFPWTMIAVDPGGSQSAALIIDANAEARATIDGMNWVDADTVNVLSGPGNAPRCVGWVGGGVIDFWIAAGASTIFTRPRDFPGATAWTARANPVASDWNAIAWGPGVVETIVIVGTGGKIASSADGISFANRSPAFTDDLGAVCFGNGLYVAVGANGRILTSPDGIAWTSRTSGTSNALGFVTWDPRSAKFVAISTAGTVHTSPDGVTWSAGTAISGDPLAGPPGHDGEGTIVVLQDAAKGGAWLSLARRSTVQISTDGGATWEVVGRISGNFKPRAIAWGRELGWLAAGGVNAGTGVVYQSGRT